MRDAAYRIILLAIRHIPELLENPRHPLPDRFLERNMERLSIFWKNRDDYPAANRHRTRILARQAAHARRDLPQTLAKHETPLHLASSKTPSSACWSSKQSQNWKNSSPRFPASALSMKGRACLHAALSGRTAAASEKSLAAKKPASSAIFCAKLSSSSAICHCRRDHCRSRCCKMKWPKATAFRSMRCLPGFTLLRRKFEAGGTDFQILRQR